MNFRPKLWLLVLFVVGVALTWISIRWSAIQTLRIESNIDVEFQILGHTDSHEKTESMVWLFATKVNTAGITGALKEPMEVGKALSKFGAIEDLTCSKNQPLTIDGLLDGLVPHQRITRLYLSSVELEDKTIHKLGKCTKLSEVTVVGALGNAENWPAMNDLKELDISFTPVSDKGFLRIVISCPKLERIQLQDAKLTKAGIETAIASLGSRKCAVLIAGVPDLTDEWRTNLAKAHPNLNLRCE